MIFLSVSATIFVTAVLVFQGQQGRTQFEQGMHDLASQLQQYVDRVSTTIFSGSQYSCSISGATGRAQLSNSAGGGTGTNQDCIFLGRAIQVIPNQSKIFIYSVLGKAINSNGDTISSFAGSLPEPAIAPGPDLTEEYDTSWGTVKAGASVVTYTSGSTGVSDMVSFYNSLQDGYQGSGSGGGQSVTGRGYAWFDSDSTLASVKGASLKSCLEEQGSCANTQTISSWEVCFASTSSNQTAKLEVKSTPAGITTSVDFGYCGGESVAGGPGSPIVTTTSYSNLSSSGTVTLHGTVIPNGSNTTCWFGLGEPNKPEPVNDAQYCNVQPGSGTATVDVSVDATFPVEYPYAPHTTYFYFLCAQNATQEFVCANNISFTTP